MMFVILSERFNGKQELTERQFIGPAVVDAAELSKIHDMDWVVIINDGLPILKFVDGEQVKL